MIGLDSTTGSSMDSNPIGSSRVSVCSIATESETGLGTMSDTDCSGETAFGDGSGSTMMRVDGKVWDGIGETGASKGGARGERRVRGVLNHIRSDVEDLDDLALDLDTGGSGSNISRGEVRRSLTTSLTGPGLTAVLVKGPA